MLRKHELVSEVKKILYRHYGVDLSSDSKLECEQNATEIVDRVLALIQKEPDANKR
jgi:hypothetical protein